jgi:hypothetical protein
MKTRYDDALSEVENAGLALLVMRDKGQGTSGK